MVDYIASPGIVIPLLVLLVLIIYYLLSLTGALRESNNDLKIQLRRERTEERRKMFKLAGKKKDDTPMGKWQSLIPIMNPKTTAGGKEKRQSILTSGKMTGFAGTFSDSLSSLAEVFLHLGAAKRAALKTRQIQAAAAAAEASAGEEDGNATDIDQASLPEDGGGVATSRKKTSKSRTTVTRKPSCTDSVASTRSEIPVIKISVDEGDGAGQAPKPGTSSDASKPTVVPTRKQKVLKALIKAGKVRGYK